MSQIERICTSIPDGYGLLLSQAALFQGEFSIDWLEELSGCRPSQILSAMEEGIGKGWLTRNGSGVFCFSDMDKRESFVAQIDQRERERLQHHLLDILVKHLPDDDWKAQYVGRHLLHITNGLEGCRLLIKAGDINLKSFQTDEALRCYNKVLDDLSGSNGDEANRLFAEAAIRCSKLSMGRYNTKRVLSRLEEALARAEKAGMATCQPLLKMHLAKNEWLQGRHAKAFRYFEEGWSMVKEMDNPSLLRSATSFRIFFLYWQGQFNKIIRVYERSVPDVEKFPQGGFPLLATMMAGYCYAVCGQTSQGLGIIDAIRSYSRERGDVYVSAYAQTTLGEILLDAGRKAEAIQLLESALEEATSKRVGWVRLVTKLTLAYAYYQSKEKKRAVALLLEFLQDCRRVYVAEHIINYFYLMELCWAMEERKILRVPDLSLEKIIRTAIKGQNVTYKGIAYRYQAYLQTRDGLSDKNIIRSLENSMKFLEESGYQNQLARTRMELARLYLRIGKEKQAKEIILPALEVIPSIDDDQIPNEFRSLIPKRPTGEDLLKVILCVGQEMVTIRDNNELIQHIITTVNKITGAERGAIFLLKRERTHPRLELMGSKGLTHKEINDPSFASSMKLVQEVARSKKGCIVGENSTTNYIDLESKIIRSQICVPMILRDRVMGVLYHDNRLLNPAFKESDLELLAYFAGQAAIALDNSIAFEEIKRRSQKFKEEKLYYEEQHLQSLYFEDVVGESPGIRQVLSLVEQVAGTDTTVLVLGETGVGKELIASAIHRRSLRQNKPFIRVHCNALSESLIPSELFGHEKGAFTGAIQRRIGRFELANGGTIFLDEIGDLTPDVQIRLLRVLQTKEFERVGGHETLKSDFRLITATNRNLEKAIMDGRFRSDLYYRLNVFPIHVPLLRDRPEDIPLLAQHFLKMHSLKMNKRFKGISEEEMNKLIQYDWPGNVRELENVIERSTILSSEPVFSVPDLMLSRLPKSPHRDKPDTLKETERRHIIMVLQKTRWKVRGKGGAAEILDIKATTLESKMKKLGIQRPKRLHRGTKD